VSKAADEVFEAAVKVLRLMSRRSRPPSRCQGRYRGVEAAVEVSRLLLRCQGCCQGVKAAVEVSRLPSRCSRPL
jgi:hypothetical protein